MVLPVDSKPINEVQLCGLISGIRLDGACGSSARNTEENTPKLPVCCECGEVGHPASYRGCRKRQQPSRSSQDFNTQIQPRVSAATFQESSGSQPSSRIDWSYILYPGCPFLSMAYGIAGGISAIRATQPGALQASFLREVDDFSGRLRALEAKLATADFQEVHSLGSELVDATVALVVSLTRQSRHAECSRAMHVEGSIEASVEDSSKAACGEVSSPIDWGFVLYPGCILLGLAHAISGGITAFGAALPGALRDFFFRQVEDYTRRLRTVEAKLTTADVPVLSLGSEIAEATVELVMSLTWLFRQSEQFRTVPNKGSNEVPAEASSEMAGRKARELPVENTSETEEASEVDDYSTSEFEDINSEHASEMDDYSTSEFEDVTSEKADEEASEIEDGVSDEEEDTSEEEWSDAENKNASEAKEREEEYVKTDSEEDSSWELVKFDIAPSLVHSHEAQFATESIIYATSDCIPDEAPNPASVPYGPLPEELIQLKRRRNRAVRAYSAHPSSENRSIMKALVSACKQRIPAFRASQK